MPFLAEEVTFDATIVAAAESSARLSDFPALRKELPKQAGDRVAGHFLKHADEQTVIALEALRLAGERFHLDPAEQVGWGIVGAPRYIGRMAGRDILSRFARGGGGHSVPTHAAAQYSLNSIPGAASIILGIHGPSVGVGGGPWSIGDGLVAALTMFDPNETPGVWLLMTQWNPDPPLPTPGSIDDDSLCHAVALALQPHTASFGKTTAGSTLRLTFPTGQVTRSAELAAPRVAEPSVAQMAAQIAKGAAGFPVSWSCCLPSGVRAELQLAATDVRLRLAA